MRSTSLQESKKHIILSLSGQFANRGKMLIRRCRRRDKSRSIRTTFTSDFFPAKKSADPIVESTLTSTSSSPMLTSFGLDAGSHFWKCLAVWLPPIFVLVPVAFDADTDADADETLLDVIDENLAEFRIRCKLNNQVFFHFHLKLFTL